MYKIILYTTNAYTTTCKYYVLANIAYVSCRHIPKVINLARNTYMVTRLIGESRRFLKM